MFPSGSPRRLRDVVRERSLPDHGVGKASEIGMMIVDEFVKYA